MLQNLRKIEGRLNSVEKLWNNIEDNQQSLPISREHIAILDQRLATFEKEKESAKPTRSMLIEMKARLGCRD